MYSRRLVIKNKEVLVHQLVGAHGHNNYHYIDNITEHDDHYLFQILHNGHGKSYPIRLSRKSVEGMYVMYDMLNTMNNELLTKDKLEDRHIVLKAISEIVKMDM